MRYATGESGIGVFARISAVLGHVDEIYMGNPGLLPRGVRLVVFYF
jgi:hypothetical protein